MYIPYRDAWHTTQTKRGLFVSVVFISPTSSVVVSTEMEREHI